jgi:[acyl-carrier-protein] S-malonyltransferase
VAISGESAAVAAAGEALLAAGARKVVPLNVSGAFHSPLLAGAGREFTAFLADIDVADARVPLLANVSAAPVTAGADLKDGFARQLTSPVLWHDIMLRIAAGDDPPPLVLEVGPGKVLTGLARRAYPATRFVPVGTTSELDGVLDILAGG